MLGTFSKIYDLTLKCALDLSSGAVIDFINGLFGESLPLDSEVIRTATESVSADLGGHTFSDKMITIRSAEHSRRFHIEAEITSDDKEIVLKVFDYGYKDALKQHSSKAGNIILNFPQPKIIYLEHWSTAPDAVTLEINFWEQSKVNFTVPTMKFLDYSVKDLDEKRMVILLPLYLLKLRRKVESARGKEAIRQYVPELKELLNKEILGTLTKNVEKGNITRRDAHILIKLLSLMYNHLYGAIEEFEEEKVKGMLAEKLVLENEYEVLAAREEVREEMRAQLASEMLADGKDIVEIVKYSKLAYEDVLRLKELALCESYPKH